MVIAQNIHPHQRRILTFRQVVLLKTNDDKQVEICFSKYFIIQVLSKRGPA